MSSYTIPYLFKLVNRDLYIEMEQAGHEKLEGIIAVTANFVIWRFMVVFIFYYFLFF